MKIGIVLLVSLVTLGCASTKMTKVQVNQESASGPFDKIMVIGLGTSEETRAAFETAVTSKLTSEGLTSVASNTQFASQKDMTRDGVRDRAKSDGMDGVLVSRLVDVRKAGDRVNETGSFTDWWEEYGTRATDSARADETTTFVIETRLFDVATEKPVYAAVSESFAPDSRDEIIADLAKLIVSDLEKRGMITKK